MATFGGLEIKQFLKGENYIMLLGKTFETVAHRDFDLNGTKQFYIHKGQKYLCTGAFGGYMVRFGTSEVHFPWGEFEKYFVEPEKRDW